MALTLASFLLSSGWELARPPDNPFMDLSGRFTDHFSHMNAARLFTRFGADIWRKPLLSLLPRPNLAEYLALPDDVKRCADCLFVAPGWRKPVEQSWPAVVRFYPPGDLVLMAPIAALYHFTDLSFTNANRLLLVLLLALAHLGIFLLVGELVGSGAGWLAVLTGFFAVNLVLRWTLEGFYDSALLVPLVLCWRYLQKQRGLAALVAFCAAAFLHFRAYYYSPWAVAALLLLHRQQAWRTWTRREWMAALLAAAMGLLSLWTYFLALPGLMRFRGYDNPLLIGRGHLDAPALLAFAAVLGLAMVLFWAARSAMDAAMAGFITLVLTQVRQSFAWYPVAVVPWLCAPPWAASPARARFVLAGRLILFLFLALYVHVDSPHPIDPVVPTWLFR